MFSLIFQDLLHHYRSMERDLDAKLEEAKANLTQLENDQVRLEQESKNLTREIEQIRKNTEERGLKFAEEDKVLTREIETLKRDLLQFKERGKQVDFIAQIYLVF